MLAEPRYVAVGPAGRPAASKRTAFPPMTAAMSVSDSPSASSASVSSGIPVASNGVGTAPSKSEPSPTCSTPASSMAATIERAIAAASSPPLATGQNPIPTSPPVAAIPRTWSSGRLRMPGAAARTPVCDATTGRAANDRTSSIVADEAWATSMITPSRLHP